MKRDIFRGRECLAFLNTTTLLVSILLKARAKGRLNFPISFVRRKDSQCPTSSGIAERMLASQSLEFTLFPGLLRPDRKIVRDGLMETKRTSSKKQPK